MSVLSDFPEVGDLFLGRYRIESILGSGGFARVYRATQTDLERDVAIKVMRPGIDREDSTEETIAQIELVEQRFRREAKIISRFRSPNTVVVHDYGRTDGGLLYMTLEHVDGETLSRIIKRDAPLEPARAVTLVRQVLDSLHEAHAFDVLHRDIKPQNLMVFSHLDQHDLVKVLDFGIAKVLEVDEEAAAVQELTTDGTLIGTPRYMSPEQIRGDRLTPASDIYSLGLVLYEALTGEKAVAERTTMRIIAVHLDPRPIEFPPDKPLGAGIRQILEKMLAKEPEDRFQSAKEVMAALDRWDPSEPFELPEQPEKPERPKVPSLPAPKPRERVATPTIGAMLAPKLDAASEDPPQADSEAENAPTLLVEPDEVDTDPELEVPGEAVDPSVAQTQQLTAEEIEEISREERQDVVAPMVAETLSSETEQEEDSGERVVAPIPVSPNLPQQLVAELDEDDTLDKPAAMFWGSPPVSIVAIAAVVLLLVVVGLVALNSGDEADATAAVESATAPAEEVEQPEEVEAPAPDPEVTEHAELDNPELAPEGEAPTKEPQPPEESTAAVVPSVDAGAEAAEVEQAPAESEGPTAEPAEETPTPRPRRKPKKRNKLWSLE